MHPYTEALFEAVPDPYIKRTELKGLSGEQPVRTEDSKAVRSIQDAHMQQIVVNRKTGT